jgi:hypothetical protein
LLAILALTCRQETPLHTPQQDLLRPPKLEKNWLISPPGSPPSGWEQISEDPPNTKVLPSDLVHVLSQYSHADAHESDVTHKATGTQTRQRQQSETLMLPSQNRGHVGIVVENWSEDNADDGDSNQMDEISSCGTSGPRRPITRTALPPL